MKESKFIGQNKKSWQEFDADLRSGTKKVSMLNRLFVQITDDLSYARTFYKFRSVKVYLNGIAQVLFNDLYRNQTGMAARFKNFWKEELPSIIHESRREFRISFFVFILAMAIGVLSSIFDKDFASLILGDSYVQMTLENIKNNDPMAVYKDSHALEMFFSIAVNNLRVVLISFLFGLIASIGSLFILLYNGIMVGAFQYFFIERGLFKESFLTIWQHGALEISMIVLAGAAGITLGRGFIFPGTYSRIEAFKLSAVRGLKIFFGITPVIILAAFIEGFVTRHTDIVDSVRIAVILLSFCFVLLYFVWYPWYLSKRKNTKVYASEQLSYKEPWNFNFSKILSAEEILGCTLNFFKRNSLWILFLLLGAGVVHSIVAVIKYAGQSNKVLFFNASILQFASAKQNLFHFFLGVFTMAILMILLTFRIRRTLNKRPLLQPVKAYLNLIIGSVFTSFIILVPLTLGLFWEILSMLFIAPVLFFALYQSVEESIFFLSVFPRTFNLLGNSWIKLFWNSIKIFFLLFIFFLLLSSPLVYQYVQSIFMNFELEESTISFIRLFMLVMIYIFLFMLFFAMQMSTSAFSYYACNEIVNATGLHERIKKFGERDVLFGFEKEKQDE